MSRRPTHLQTLRKRRAMRFLTKRYHNTSIVTDMLADLKWETLQERRSKFRVVMMYKIGHQTPLDPEFLAAECQYQVFAELILQMDNPTWNSLLAGIVEGGNIDLVKACLARYSMTVPM